MLIEETEARKTLQIAYALAYRQWIREGMRLDLTEYYDAALDVLPGCLERYCGTKKSFSSYAYLRMRGAVQDAREQYQHWQECRVREMQYRAVYDAAFVRPVLPTIGEDTIAFTQQWAHWPSDLQRYAAGVLRGDLDQEYAAQEGITTGAVSARKKRWQALLTASYSCA